MPLPGLSRRIRALGKALASVDADIVCLQEVGRWRYLPLLRVSDTTWPHMFATSYPYMPKGGVVAFSCLDVHESSFQPFQERGRAASLHATERYQGKGILSMKLMMRERKIVVLNTHLSANYSAQWSYQNPYAKVERAQLREIAHFVQSIPNDTLVVVAGDLNVPRGSWLYEEFCTAANLFDPLAESVESTYRPLPGMPARAAQALDHILVRAPHDMPLTLHSELCFREPVWLAQKTRGYLSDHLGVRLTLRWTEAEAGEIDQTPSS